MTPEKAETTPTFGSLIPRRTWRLLFSLIGGGGAVMLGGLVYLWNLCVSRPSMGPNSCYHHPYTLTSPIGLGVDMLVGGLVVGLVGVAVFMVVLYRIPTSK